jgi:hypothetical protein
LLPTNSFPNAARLHSESVADSSTATLDDAFTELFIYAPEFRVGFSA